MDGTTAVLDISTLIYNGATTNRNTTYTATGGKLSHNTAAGKIMPGDTYSTTSYFYIDSYIDQNARADKTGAQILNDDMFQFTTKSNGTVAAVEVSGNGTGATATVDGSTVTTTAKKALRSLDVAVGTDALYNGKLLTNSATIFLVRSGNGDTVPFTYKSVTGIIAIGNYVQGEVDYVDLNDDGVSDYVYIIAASDTAKA